MSLESEATSLQCAITKCKRPADVLCYCCKENLCRNHYNEHNYLNSKLNILVNEVDTFDRQLSTADLKNYIQNSHDKLQQWRLDSYKTIDQYCDRKYREIEQYLMKVIQEKRDNIDQIRANILESVQRRQITVEAINSFTSRFVEIEQNINALDQNYLSVQTTPLTVEKDLIQIREVSIGEFDISLLKGPFKTIGHLRHGLYPISSGNQYLLIQREQHLCLLDRDLRIAKRTHWNYGQILNMCWSSAWEKFFLITFNQIYMLDVNKILVEHVETTRKVNWLSCTCSDTSLFLSTNEKGSAICEFSLLNSLQAANRWDTPVTCSINEQILDMIFNRGTLLLIIGNSLTEKSHVELRSSTNLDRHWSLELDNYYVSKLLKGCTLNYDQWLIVDSNTSRIFQITKDGKLKATCYYNPTPAAACRFGANLLAISTLHGISIHQI